MTDGTAGSPLATTSSAPPTQDYLTAAFSENGMLEVFERLPRSDQKNFARWVNTGSTEAKRDERARILRRALEVSPLARESRPDLPDNGRPR